MAPEKSMEMVDINWSDDTEKVCMCSEGFVDDEVGIGSMRSVLACNVAVKSNA